jgi:hypothetical protein
LKAQKIQNMTKIHKARIQQSKIQKKTKKIQKNTKIQKRPKKSKNPKNTRKSKKIQKNTKIQKLPLHHPRTNAGPSTPRAWHQRRTSPR